MTTAIRNYALVLHSLSVNKTDVDSIRQLFEDNDDLKKALSDPRVKFSDKEKVISRLNTGKMESFLKVVCKNNKIVLLSDIFDEYESILKMSDGTLVANIICVVPPTEEQQKRIIDFVKRKYNAKNVVLDIKEDKSLIGGFIIKCGDMEFDRSMSGRLTKLQQKLIGEMK